MTAKKIFFIGVALVMFGLALLPPAGAENTPTMTKEELKGMLDNPELVILDVRRGKDWDASEFKIKGAERMNPSEFGSWGEKYAKDKTLVLYCA